MGLLAFESKKRTQNPQGFEFSFPGKKHSFPKRPLKEALDHSLA